MPFVLEKMHNKAEKRRDLQSANPVFCYAGTFAPVLMWKSAAAALVVTAAVVAASAAVTAEAE